MFFGCCIYVIAFMGSIQTPVYIYPAFYSVPYIVNAYEENPAFNEEMSSPAYESENDWIWENQNSESYAPGEDVLVQRDTRR